MRRRNYERRTREEEGERMSGFHIGPIDLDYKQTCHWAAREAEKAWESARVAEKRARKLRDILRQVAAVERYNEIHGGEVDQAKAKL